MQSSVGLPWAARTDSSVRVCLLCCYRILEFEARLPGGRISLQRIEVAPRRLLVSGDLLGDPRRVKLGRAGFPLTRLRSGLDQHLISLFGWTQLPKRRRSIDRVRGLALWILVRGLLPGGAGCFGVALGGECLP